jgi:mercuric ion transport protein
MKSCIQWLTTSLKDSIFRQLPVMSQYKNNFITSLAGTLLVAVCCFTPVLVIALGAAGLSAYVPYLDFILIPALAVLVIITVVSYIKWKKTGR